MPIEYEKLDGGGDRRDYEWDMVREDQSRISEFVDRTVGIFQCEECGDSFKGAGVGYEGYYRCPVCGEFSLKRVWSSEDDGDRV